VTTSAVDHDDQMEANMAHMPSTL